MYESKSLSKINYLNASKYLLIDINIPTSFIGHYETIPSSPVRSSYENNTQQPVYVSFESNPFNPIRTFSEKSIIPPFQRRFPIASVAILGFFELIAGLIILALELLVFDIAVGLWCGGVYALAGAAIIVLGMLKINVLLNFIYSYSVIGTDRERHQTSAVLIFQFVGKIKMMLICFLKFIVLL
jgi:hypothetical protein